MSRKFSTFGVTAVFLFCLVVLPTPGGDIFNQDPSFPECIDPEIDPFCPAGFPSDGGGDGGGGGYTCQRCTKAGVWAPDGTLLYWVWECVSVTPSTEFNSSQKCTAHSSGCTQSDWCVIA